MKETTKIDWDKIEWIAIFSNHLHLRTGAPKEALNQLAIHKINEGELNINEDPVIEAEVFIFELKEESK